MAEERYVRQRTLNPISSYLHKVFLNEKLNNWVGYLLLVFIAVGFGYLVATDFKIGVGILGGVIGLSAIILCITNPEIGLYMNLAYVFMASFLGRLLFNGNFPFGVVTDILVVSTFFGLLIGKYNLKKTTGIFLSRKPVLFFVVILIYLCFQIANPAAHSFQGWIHIIRKVLESILLLFIAYNVFTDHQKIWRFLKVLFGFAVLAGFYGCIQQWHGLFPFEINWVHSDPIRLELIYIWGIYRKFSFFSGPTEFGIIMGACSLLFMILGINQKKPLNKYILIIGSIIMMMGMSYSGTRTANAMLVGGIGLFVLLTINKRSTKIFAFFALMAFLFIMYAPIYSSAAILRFRTSFSGSEDASYNVRERNRAAIQPYIYKHPFGGGLSTTGEMGKKYNPGHALAGFPTDSSYLNKALETGWIGFGLTLVLYFVTLQYAIQGFFMARSNQVKMMFAAIAAFAFSFYIGEIAQEAIGLFVNMVVYFPVVAILIRLKELGIREIKQEVH